MNQKISNANLLKYQGKENFFAGLIKDKEENYYIFITHTNGIDIIHEIEEVWLNKTIKYSSDNKLKLEIPIYANKNGKMMTLIQLNNIEEYFTIIKVLEAIL